MAWETLVKRGGRGGPALTGFTVRLAAKQVTIAIGRDVAAAAGLSTETRLVVLVGTGEHAGRLRLSKAATGRRLFLPKGRVGTMLLKFARWPAITAEKAAAAAVEHKLDADGEGALEITLPGWGRPQRQAARAA